MDTPDSTTLKRCSKCGQFKARDAFYKITRARDGLCYQCKECVSRQKRESYAKNPERTNERNRLYYSKHADALNEQQRQHRLTPEGKAVREQYLTSNAERIAEQRRNHYIANADRLREARREYGKSPKGQEQARKYRTSHVEQQRRHRKKYLQSPSGRAASLAYNHKRRARKLAAGGSFTPADIEAIRIAQGNRCYLCHKKLAKYHIDHFIPLSKGGTNDAGNLRLACPRCNQEKYDKHPFELGVLL